MTACLNWFERARGGGGCTSEAFHGHTVVSNHPSVQQVHISIPPSLSLYLLVHNNVASLRWRAFSRKTTDTPHIFPTFPPPAFLWWMLAGESSSCNRKILVFDFLELSRCVVYSVFWRVRFRRSLTAAKHQGRLGHQPQAPQVECEFTFVNALTELLAIDVSVLGHRRSENIAFDVFCFLGHRPRRIAWSLCVGLSKNSFLEWFGLSASVIYLFRR